MGNAARLKRKGSAARRSGRQFALARVFQKARKHTKSG
jgi:hypothetical protein